MSEEELREAFEEGWYQGCGYGMHEQRTGHPKTEKEQLEIDWEQFKNGYRV